MGLTPGSSAEEAMKLCVFDLKRGQIEGQELDKILFFHPADLPLPMQLSVIGLSEGLITFTRIFSPDAACEVIEAEMHSHVFYEAEPDLWMVLVIEKTKESDSIRRFDALQRVLKEIHSLFVMFHGPIRALVDKEPTGALARSHLYYFIMDFLSDIYVGKKLHLPNFRHSLKERGTVQMLTVGREDAIEVQSFVRTLESCTGNTGCYSLTMFQDLLVTINLSSIDTVGLFTYAVLRLTSHALSSTANSSQIFDRYYNSRDASSAGIQSYRVVRPLQHAKWSKRKDGDTFHSSEWGARNHFSEAANY